MKNSLKKPIFVSSGLYYKHIMILHYESSIVNRFGASLTDDARVVIYDYHMFIVHATSSMTVEFSLHKSCKMYSGPKLSPGANLIKLFWCKITHTYL
jgi:hypothetical protein